MVVAFSVNLALLEAGENNFQALNAPPQEKQWPFNCPADFPAFVFDF